MVARGRPAAAALLAPALCLAAVGCGAFGDSDAALAQAFRVPCVYPRDPVVFERIGTPCLLPASEPSALTELPCGTNVFVSTSYEDPRSWSRFLYDDQGRIVAEQTGHQGRLAPSSFKYTYETSGSTLTVKRARWYCDREPVFDESVSATFGENGLLSTVETGERTIRLRYESSRLGLRTDVKVSDGATMYGFKLNRRGNIVSRNSSGEDFPTALDYDYDGDLVTEVVERSRRSTILRKTVFTWEGERLDQVDVTSYGHGRPFTESTRFKYQCNDVPECNPGFEPPAPAAAQAPPPASPAEPKPAVAPVDPAKIDGMQRAREVQRRIDEIRRGTGKLPLRWDDALFSVAQREADDRSRGVTVFDPMSLHMFGYRVAVRVERLGASAGAPPESDVQTFASADVWDALGSRSVGVGVARIGNGLPDTGKLALIVISAIKER